MRILSYIILSLSLFTNTALWADSICEAALKKLPRNQEERFQETANAVKEHLADASPDLIQQIQDAVERLGHFNRTGIVEHGTATFKQLKARTEDIREALRGIGLLPEAARKITSDVIRRGAAGEIRKPDPPFRGSRGEREELTEFLQSPLDEPQHTPRLLSQAKEKLEPSRAASFTKWFLGQFAEDAIVNFEDQYLGRQRTEFPEGPSRYNKNGERPFDGYLAARDYLAGLSLDEIGISDILKTHHLLMSRESIRADKGKVFQLDGRPARNSQGLNDSDLGRARNENVGFDVDGKHLPQGVSAVGKTIFNLIYSNPQLSNERPGFVGYASLSGWARIDRRTPLSNGLVYRIRQLEKKYGTKALDRSEDPEVKETYRAFLEELTARMWEEAKTDIKKASTAQEAISAAAHFQRNLASVHPFLDGNGRLVRVLTEKLLESRGLPSPLYVHWGEDLALDRGESEAHLARSVLLSKQFQAELENSLGSGEGYETVPNPVLAIRAKEILGDPTGGFDSRDFVRWTSEHRDEFPAFSEAVRGYATTHPMKKLGEELSPEQVESAKKVMASKAPFFDPEEFVLWRREHSKPGRALAEEVRDYANWIDDLVYEDKTGAVRLASPAFQKSFGKLSSSQQEYDEKMAGFYSEEKVFRGVPSNKYLSDLEMVKLFSEPSGFITGNGVDARRGPVSALPAFQQFNAGLLRDISHLKKQVIDHKDGLEDDYHMSGMVSFSEEMRVAEHWKVSYSDLGAHSLVFTARKREVGVINTAKKTKKLGQNGLINEREEALIGGADPESILQVELTQAQPDSESGAIQKTKTAKRLDYNTIEIIETVQFIAKPPETHKSVWRITNGTALLLRDGEIKSE